MKRSSLLTLVFAAGAAVLGAVLPARAADPVKIGILWPLTGNAAAAGQAAKAAIEVALDIINKPHPELGNLPLAATAGLPGLGGAPIDVVFVDHEGNPSTAQQLATRLITQDKVVALMGAYQSSCSFTATAVAVGNFTVSQYGTGTSTSVVVDAASTDDIWLITAAAFKAILRFSDIIPMIGGGRDRRNSVLFKM